MINDNLIFNLKNGPFFKLKIVSDFKDGFSVMKQYLSLKII